MKRIAAIIAVLVLALSFHDNLQALKTEANWNNDFITS